MATGTSTTTIAVEPAGEKPDVRIETSLNYEANHVSQENPNWAWYFDQIS